MEGQRQTWLPLSHSPSSLPWRRSSIKSAASFPRCTATSPSSLSLKNFVPCQSINTPTRRPRGPPCLAKVESNPTFSHFEQLQVSEEHCNKGQRHSGDVKPDHIQEETITSGFIKEMILDFRNQKILDKKYVYEIVKKARDLFRPLPSLVDVIVPDGKHLTVCGDIHGQLDDLLHIFELNGFPSENNPYIFNGDFVDRGQFSVEVILTLFSFKCLCPSAIHLNRGNHESQYMNKGYGFHNEVRDKLGEEFIQQFDEVFQCLPLAHVINQKVLVVHGGLPVDEGVKLTDIRAIHRFCEPPMEGLLTELLWNDPAGPGSPPGSVNRMRGVGYLFGVYVTKRFLRDNNLDLVVRSHQVRSEGYEVEHEGKLITVFSASNYCGMRGNKGAFIRFAAPELKPDIVTYLAPKPLTSCVPHCIEKSTLSFKRINSSL